MLRLSAFRRCASRVSHAKAVKPARPVIGVALEEEVAPGAVGGPFAAAPLPVPVQQSDVAQRSGSSSVKEHPSATRLHSTVSARCRTRGLGLSHGRSNAFTAMSGVSDVAVSMHSHHAPLATHMSALPVTYANEPIRQMHGLGAGFNAGDVRAPNSGSIDSMRRELAFCGQKQRTTTTGDDARKLFTGNSVTTSAWDDICGGMERAVQVLGRGLPNEPRFSHVDSPVMDPGRIADSFSVVDTPTSALGWNTAREHSVSRNGALVDSFMRRPAAATSPGERFTPLEVRRALQLEFARKLPVLNAGLERALASVRIAASFGKATAASSSTAAAAVAAMSFAPGHRSRTAGGSAKGQSGTLEGLLQAAARRVVELKAAGSAADASSLELALQHALRSVLRAPGRSAQTSSAAAVVPERDREVPAEIAALCPEPAAAVDAAADGSSQAIAALGRLLFLLDFAGVAVPTACDCAPTQHHGGINRALRGLVVRAVRVVERELALADLQQRLQDGHRAAATATTADSVNALLVAPHAHAIHKFLYDVTEEEKAAVSSAVEVRGEEENSIVATRANIDVLREGGSADGPAADCESLVLDVESECPLLVAAAQSGAAAVESGRAAPRIALGGVTALPSRPYQW